MPSLKENVFYNGMVRVSSLVFPLITFPYVARILGPDELGKVNFVQSFVQIFVIMTSLGIPNYGIREIAKFKNDGLERSKIFFECLFIKSAFTVLGLLIYLILILQVVDFQAHRTFYIWGICTILLSVFDISYLYTALENFKFISLRTVAIHLVSLVFVFVFIKTKADALKYFLIPVATTFLASLVNIRYALPLVNFGSFRIDFRSVRKRLNPILFLSGIVIFSSLGSTLDKVLLGFLSDDITAVGFYTPGERINAIGLAFTMLLAPVMMPRISYLFETGVSEQIDDLISKSLSFTNLVGVPLMLGILVIAPEAIIILAGNEYIPSITALRIMSAVPFVAGFTTLFTMQIFMPLRKDKLLLWCMIAQTIICLALNVLFAPSMHQDGTALARVTTEILTLLICYYAIRTFYNLKFPGREVIINILISLPFLLFGLLTRQIFDGVLLRFLIILFSCTIYYFVVHAFILKTPMVRDILSSIENLFHGN